MLQKDGYHWEREFVCVLVITGVFKKVGRHGEVVQMEQGKGERSQARDQKVFPFKP